MKVYNLSLNEKKRECLHTVTKVLLFGFNVFGLLGIYMVLQFFQSAKEQDKMQDIAELYFETNFYAGNQLQIMADILIAILICLMIGIIFIFIKMIQNDSKERKSNVKLLYALGYKSRQRFIYEFQYKLFDSAAAYLLGSVIFTFFWQYIKENASIKKLQEEIGLEIFSLKGFSIVFVILLIIVLFTTFRNIRKIKN